MSPPTGDDPFDDLVLDEAFVRSASRVENSADVRAAAAARARDAHQLLEREHAEQAAASAAAAAAARRARRRQRLVRPVALLAALALLAGAVGWARGRPEPTVDFADAGTVLVGADGGPTLRPADRDVPFGEPPTPPSGGTTRYLMLDDDGAPVTYDPCRPLTFVVNNRTMPPGAVETVEDAVAEVAGLTGLALEIEGTTDEVPAEPRDAYQPARYGDRWAPVLIAWSDPAELTTLDGSVAGFAGSAHLERSGQAPTYVSGIVALDGPDVAAQIDDGHPEVARLVVLHELGHLLGLDHVDDRDELMYPEEQDGVNGFGPGDRRGLAALGSGPCVALR